MSGSRTVRISILGDSKNIRNAFESTERGAVSLSGKLDGLVSSMSNFAQRTASVAAGFVVAQTAMRAISAASNLVQESFFGMNSLIEQTSIAFTTMLGSAEAADTFLQDLAEFAERTPFEFPELITSAQRMMAYGFAAEQVLPLLEDVGNASAALGAGAAGVDRMTLALGQMAAKGRVQTQELLQLTELGIPAFQLLADALGVSVGEVQELVSAGEVSSDVFLKIFQEWSRANFGDMMAKQSKTAAGAISNITDVLQMGIARGLRPFYDALRDALVGVAEFLETGQFEAWVTTLSQISQVAVDALMAIPGTASAFRTWVTEIASSENPLQSFLNTMPGWFQDAATRITNLMDVGGYNAITAYAQGMIESASTNINAAVNYVSKLIGDYLIGQSPPPAGPLSQIDKAGQNLLETYAGGMMAGAKSVVAVTDTIWQTMARLEEAATLERGRAGLQAATGNLEAMEAVSGEVDTKIRQIGRSLSEIDLELGQIDRDIARINDGYDAQIRPLEEQLDLLDRQKTLREEQVALEHDLAKALVQKAQLEAMGDPERRAEIAGEMALLDLEQQRLDNEQDIADTRARLTGEAREMTAEERARLERRSRELALDRQELQQRLAQGKDLTSIERQRLQLRLEGLDADIRANQAALSGGPEELTEAERKALELKLEELELRQELLDMIDAEAAAQAEADEALLDSREKEKGLIENIADLQNEILKIPIREEIEKVEEARRKEIEPLEQQQELLGKQREDLDYLRQQWQFIQGDVNDALAPLRETARIADQRAQAAEREAEAAKRTAEANQRALESAQVDNSFEAAQARLRGEGTPCAEGWIMDPFGRCYRPDEEAWKESVREWERDKAKMDQPDPVDMTTPPAERQDVVIPTAAPIDDNLNEGMILAKPESLGAKMGRLFADGFIQRVGEVLKENAGKIMGASIGGGITALIPGVGKFIAPLGALVGAKLGGSIQDEIERRGISFDTIRESFNTRVRPVIQEVTAFIQDRVTPGFTEFARVIREDVWPVVEQVFGFLWEHKETIAAIVAGIATAVVVFKTLSGAVAGFLAAKAFLVGLPALIAPLMAALTPVVLVIAAIAAAVGLLVVAWMRNWGDIQGKTRAVWDWLRPNLDALGERINRFVVLILPELRGAWENIWSAIKWVAGAIWTVVSTVFNAVSGFLDSHGDTIMRMVSFYWDYISTVINTTLGMISNVIQFVLNIIQGDWSGAWENVKEYFRIAWEGIQELLGLAVTAVQTAVEEALPVIVEKLGEWASAFLDWVTDSVLPFIGEKIEEIGTRIWNWVSGDGLSNLREKLKGWGAAFIDWVQEQVLGEGGLVSKLPGVASAIVGWIGDKNAGATKFIKDKLLEFATAFLEWIKDDVLPYLAEKLGAILTAIVGWATDTDNLKKLATAMGDLGKEMLAGIAKGIYDTFDDTLGRAIEWAADKVPDFLKDRWGIESPAKAFMPIGGAAMEGLMAGAQDQESNLVDTFGRLGDHAKNSLNLDTSWQPGMVSAISTTRESRAADDPERMAAAIVRAFRESDSGRPLIIALDGRVIYEGVLDRLNGELDVKYG